jgi:hypothetical protein
MSYNNTAALKAAIQQLEEQKKMQQQELIQQFYVTKESLRPANLLRSAVSNIDGAGILGTVIKTAGTVGAGLLAGKLAGGGAAVEGGQELRGFVLGAMVYHR